MEALLTGRLTKSHDPAEITFGISEGIERRNALSFFETWLPKILNLETKKGRVRHKYHRGLGRPKAGVSRVVIMKLHNPTDKINTLMKQKLEYEWAKITIRQDIPPTVLQQRRNFNAECQQLIAKKCLSQSKDARITESLCPKENNPRSKRCIFFKDCSSYII